MALMILSGECALCSETPEFRSLNFRFNETFTKDFDKENSSNKMKTREKNEIVKWFRWEFNTFREKIHDGNCLWLKKRKKLRKLSNNIIKIGFGIRPFSLPNHHHFFFLFVVSSFGNSLRFYHLAARSHSLSFSLAFSLVLSLRFAEQNQFIRSWKCSQLTSQTI